MLLFTLSTCLSFLSWFVFCSSNLMVLIWSDRKLEHLPVYWFRLFISDENEMQKGGYGGHPVYPPFNSLKIVKRKIYGATCIRLPWLKVGYVKWTPSLCWKNHYRNPNFKVSKSKLLWSWFFFLFLRNFVFDYKIFMLCSTMGNKTLLLCLSVCASAEENSCLSAEEVVKVLKRKF